MHKPHQRSSGLKHVPSRRFFGGVDGLCDLAKGQFLTRSQQEHRPLRLRKLGQGTFEGSGQFLIFDGCARFRIVGRRFFHGYGVRRCQARRRGASGIFPASAVQESVGGDPHQPRPEVGAGCEGVAALGRTKKRLLHKSSASWRLRASRNTRPNTASQWSATHVAMRARVAASNASGRIPSEMSGGMGEAGKFGSKQPSCKRVNGSTVTALG